MDWFLNYAGEAVGGTIHQASQHNVERIAFALLGTFNNHACLVTESCGRGSDAIQTTYTPGSDGIVDFIGTILGPSIDVRMHRTKGAAVGDPYNPAAEILQRILRALKDTADYSQQFFDTKVVPVFRRCSCAIFNRNVAAGSTFAILQSAKAVGSSQAIVYYFVSATGTGTASASAFAGFIRDKFKQIGKKARPENSESLGVVVIYTGRHNVS
ncbi:hypothetical protein EJ08DRAFT_677197 [Tothia fuscella]|uniref:Uncharacterized protein n=1 Tax=Tothia fuscella TaxID=1048955 RepID=A0A9P4NX17_9PEZI|nr:hypothetical protein EJ08DRAFT_677197 [Tothia fuscella]